MGGAKDEVAGQIEELVRLPLQVDAGVRTAVAIGVDLRPAAHQQDLQRPLRQLQADPAAAGIVQLLQTTDRIRLNHDHETT